MSGIIGPITAGRIAFALGTVGVGALVGGAVADHNDGDIATGALIGGASALAGLALLYGGATAWKHFSAAKTGAAAGATALGSLTHATPASTLPALSTAATHAAPATTTLASTTLTTATSTTTATGWRAWVSSLFHESSAVSTLRPLPVTVPTIARTPVLPVATASSGSTFLSTMSRFLPG